MHVVTVADPAAFRARTEALLLRDEARHNLMLGILSTLIDQPGVYQRFHLWVVEDEAGSVGAAALRTPPFNLLVSQASDEASAALAAAIHHEGQSLPGVTASPPEVEGFVRAWTGLSGSRARLFLDQGVYALTAVAPVEGVPGAMREAGPEDRDLLIEWTQAFVHEALPGPSPMSAVAMVDHRLEGHGSGFALWETGRPVSASGYWGATPHGIRIGPVYTPPDHRRHGYASALVAALSQRLLDEGRRFCFLFTDMANPTSNRIYRNVGYEWVCESKDYHFEPPGA
jgi:predicted GNAT family acetyltransferase